MARRLIGEVSHYFTNIGVAVLELKTVLRQGETVEFEKRDRTWKYKQKVRSMELERKKVKEAKKGWSVGMKVNKPIKKGFRVYKVAATAVKKAPAKKTARKPVKKAVKKKPASKCPPKRKCKPPAKRAAKKVVRKPARKVARKPLRKTAKRTARRR